MRLVNTDNHETVEVEKYLSSTPIWFKGSKFNQSRAIYMNVARAYETHYYVNWYGRFIEVEKNDFGNWRTVEQY